MQKVALITGITGQDGIYLSELLLSQGYEVHGLRRRNSQTDTLAWERLLQMQKRWGALHFHYGDLIDTGSLIRVIKLANPHEVYNLAAMSHVKVSYDIPEYTANANALGALRLLEAIKVLGLEASVKFFQASTSEIYGNKARQSPQNEQTAFDPQSPYGIAKLFAHQTTAHYRDAHGLFACNGILYNHESPLRGDDFLTRKITKSAARIALGMKEVLLVGNLEAQRDWGHAQDYAQAMWLILQQKNPADYVIASGKSTSIRQFIMRVFGELGIEISFEGEGLNEIGYISECRDPEFLLTPGTEIVKVNPQYFRPQEKVPLVGDPGKIRSLGWTPKFNLETLIQEMVATDLEKARQDKYQSNLSK